MNISELGLPVLDYWQLLEAVESDDIEEIRYVVTNNEHIIFHSINHMTVEIFDTYMEKYDTTYSYKNKQPYSHPQDSLWVLNIGKLVYDIQSGLIK